MMLQHEANEQSKFFTFMVGEQSHKFAGSASSLWKSPCKLWMDMALTVADVKVALPTIHSNGRHISKSRLWQGSQETMIT